MRLLLLFILAFCSFSFAQTGNPPVANNDFYILDQGQYVHTSRNDEEYDGHYWSTVGGPAASWVLPTGCGGHYTPTCQYVNPGSSPFGFTYYEYKYSVCCGNPPGPDSNIATVFLLVIPKDDAQNAGRSCPLVGKPVKVTNGNMWIEQTDYSLPGRGDVIEIDRFYNSIIQSSGLFGFG